ncbi:MAG: dipeptidase PepE [Thermoanaerobaculia bacterium]
MKRLLLVSSSKVHGSGYLEHCEAQTLELFARIDKVLFVPYALFDRDAYARQARQRFRAMGLELESIHETKDPVAAVGKAAGIFIGGGNSFRLLGELQQRGLVAPIRDRVEAGMPYLGTSAGSNIACPTIKTTNDMPIVQPASFTALGLIPFQINPHYLDSDPDSTHQGETREQRLTEYLEENDTPVIAIREGGMIVVAGLEIKLEGKPGGVLFRKGQRPEEILPGRRIDGL